MSHDPHDEPHNLLGGAVALIVSGFLLAGMDAINKHLMQNIDPVQVLWGRYIFHTLIVALVLKAQGNHGFLVPQAKGLQALRAFTLLGVTAFMYFALTSVPLADATAIMFFAPVLLTLIAPALLGESIRLPHMIAVGMGFIGVLAVVQPGFREIEWKMLLPIGSAISLALYMVLTRKLKHRDKERTTQFHSTFLGTVILTLLVPFWWQSISLLGWLLLIGGGALGAIGHFLIIRAFHMAPASQLSPFTYVQLLAATLYSVWWFGDPLTPGFWVGTALIVSGGLMIGRLKT